jgi:type II secretory pathway pseudopilin PulG
MLVVLTILGVMAGAVAPAILRVVDEDELTAATRAATSLIERARHTAVLRAVPVTLRIDPTEARYWVIAEEAAADSLLASGRLELPAGVHVESGHPRPQLRFAPTGALGYSDAVVLRSAAGAVTVTSTSWQGSKVRDAQ